jgi:hypothetical protein
VGSNACHDSNLLEAFHNLADFVNFPRFDEPIRDPTVEINGNGAVVAGALGIFDWRTLLGRGGGDPLEGPAPLFLNML